MATNRTVAAAAAAKLQAQQHSLPTLSATLDLLPAGKEGERGKSQSRHLPIILATCTDSQTTRDRQTGSYLVSVTATATPI